MTTLETLITEQLDIWSSAVVTQSTAGRGKRKKLNLYGIKKLRELILELAVRGQLVPQDPDDEPASVLLERIAVEKARLVKEKKIRKTKVLPPITDDEKPFGLSKGWKWARFNEISYLITDGAHHTPTYIDKGIPFLSVKDMSSGSLNFKSTRYISQQQHEELSKRCHPKKGDLLLTKVGTTGIPVLVDTNLEFSLFVSVALIKFPADKIDGAFLVLLIKSPLVKRQSESGTKGIGNKNLVLRKINAFSLTIPPLAEQHRIVAKVDELMSLCDTLEQAQESSINAHQTLVENLLNALTHAAHQGDFDQAWTRIAAHFDTLFTTEHSIDQLKQTILQLAIMGKLVAQDPQDEPARVLLAKIAAEKAQLIKAKKIKKQKVLPPIGGDNKPFGLPDGWEFARLTDIGQLDRGKSKHRPRNDPSLYVDGNIPLIQTGDVARSNGTIKTHTALYNERGLAQSKLWPKGTMCITIAANIADTGILGFDACFPDSVVGFIPFDSKIPVKYFDFFIRVMKTHFEKYAPSTAQKNINLGILNNVPVPFPPLHEQKRIVTKVDQLLNLCDQLKSQIISAKTTQQHLADVLAKKAVSS